MCASSSYWFCCWWWWHCYEIWQEKLSNSGYGTNLIIYYCVLNLKALHSAIIYLFYACYAPGIVLVLNSLFINKDDENTKNHQVD